MPLRPQHIAVDFDGVIHSYVQPWTRADVIKDPPTEGAIEWLNAIARDGHYRVVIFTTRATSSEGLSAIRTWLLKYKYDRAMTVDITNAKPAALLYVDDRGWRFTGKNFPTPRQIADFAVWNAELREAAAQGESS